MAGLLLQLVRLQFSMFVLQLQLFVTELSIFIRLHPIYQNAIIVIVICDACCEK